MNESPNWSIDLASQPGEVQFQFTGRRGEDLNSHGLFEIVIPEMTTVRKLLINNTAINNQTVIYCDRYEANGAPSKTTLFVLGTLYKSLQY